MSKYSTDSEDDDYRSRRSRRKRSASSSSEDSYKSRRNRRSRKSRSRSRDRNGRHAYKDGRESNRSRNYSRRSKSPPYRNKRYRSASRSRSRSRTPSHYGKSKSYSKSRRKHRSRTRSQSYSRRSRSRSRRRSRSRQRHRSRSKSSSYRRSKRTPDKPGSDSAEDRKPSTNTKYIDSVQDSRGGKRENDSSISIPSDDPIIKQEQLDEINAPSFAPKSFKSTKSDVETTTQKLLVTDLHLASNNGNVNFNEDHQICENEKRKNNTVFHDSIVFEDSEAKIQKWIKKLHKIRQKSLLNVS